MSTMTLSVPEEEPDELDKELRADSKSDNDETVSLDSFVKEIGFTPNELKAKGQIYK